MTTPRTQRRLATLLAILAMTLIPRTTHAGDPPTIHVPGDYSTLGAALSAITESGTTIQVAPGTYEFGGPISDIEFGAVTIRGAGMNDTIITPTSSEDGLRFDSHGHTIEHITFDAFQSRVFWTPNSSQIHYFNRCRFTNCAGAIRGKVDCRDCVFDHSNATDAAAVAMPGSIFVRCTFDSNHALVRGGAINGEDFFASYCTFTNNSCNDYGGAIYGEPQLLGCTLQGNTAKVAGGAIFIDTSGAEPTTALSETVMCDNAPNEIWGIWLDYGQNSIGICTCEEDLNVDGDVGFEYLVQLLSAWGQCF